MTNQTFQQYNQGPVTSQPPGYQVAFGQDGKKLVCPVQGHREWSTGVCDCTKDSSSCLIGCLCIPLLQCQIAKRLNEFACVTCCVPGADLAMRTKIRAIGGIQGSICNDCLMLNFCGPCSLCQMKRELDAMGIA